MSYILLYQLNHSIESRNYTETDSFEDIINKLIVAYNTTIKGDSTILEEKSEIHYKGKPFIDFDNLLIFLYSMFDLMLLIKDKDKEDLKYLTYGKDCIAEMILDFISKNN